MNLKEKSLTLNADTLEESGIPKPFWKLDHTTYFGNRLALRQVLKYCKKFRLAHKKGFGLFLTGEPDSMKTFLATFALKLLMAKGISCNYVDVNQVTDVHFGRVSEVYFGSFLSPDWLVVDNCDKPENDGPRQALKRLLRLRKDHLRPTIICSSLTFEEFCAEFERPISDYVRDIMLHVECEVDAFKRVAKLEQTKMKLTIQEGEFE